MTKSLILEEYGRSIPVTLQVRSYLNGNLAIQMLTCEDGEPWNTLTVNLGEKCKKDCAFIDTNNNEGYETYLGILQATGARK